MTTVTYLKTVKSTGRVSNGTMSLEQLSEHCRTNTRLANGMDLVRRALDNLRSATTEDESAERKQKYQRAKSNSLQAAIPTLAIPEGRATSPLVRPGLADGHNDLYHFDVDEELNDAEAVHHQLALWPHTRVVGSTASSALWAGVLGPRSSSPDEYKSIWAAIRDLLPDGIARHVGSARSEINGCRYLVPGPLTLNDHAIAIEVTLPAAEPGPASKARQVAASVNREFGFSSRNIIGGCRTAGLDWLGVDATMSLLMDRVRGAHRNGSSLHGYCPRHGGKSGTSFCATPERDRILVHCFGDGGCQLLPYSTLASVVEQHIGARLSPPTERRAAPVIQPRRRRHVA